MRFGRLLLCGTAAGALALAGCSATGGDGPDAQAPTGDHPTFGNMVGLVDSVTASSKDVRTTHATITATVDGKKVLTGEGDFDLRPQHRAMAMTEQLSAGALSGAGNGTMTMHFVLADKTFYIEFPPQLASLSPTLGGDPAKPWHKVDLSQAGGSRFGRLASLAQQADPAKQLQKFKSSGTITRTASERLDGQHVTHYWIKVDRRKLLRELPDGAAKQRLSGSATKLPDTLPVQLWINDRKLPLRIRTTLNQAGTPATVTVHYTDWGKPVRIDPPPPGKVGTTITAPGGGH